jgi:hypothetical protein
MKTTRAKRATDLFKPLQKWDRLTCVYLYGDGHASAAFERRERDVDQTIRYYKQIDSLGIRCRFKGRIIFSQYGGATWLRCLLAAGVTEIHASEPSIEHGTEITKAKGIAVGCLTADTPFGVAYLYNLPALMGGEFSYQADVGETFDPTLENYGSNRDTIAETLITATGEAS